MVEQLSVQQQPERITTPEKSAEELYLDALEKKRDTLLAFHTMNSVRKGKNFEEMAPEELGQYKILRENWRSKKEISFDAFENLPQDRQEGLAAMGSRLYDIQAELTLLKDLKKTSGTEMTEAVSPEVLKQESQESSDSKTEAEDKEAFEQPKAEQTASEQVIAEKPESALTLEDVEDQITRLENSSPPPLLAIEAWKAKRAELAEREDAEANPDQTLPKGFLARVKDSYNRAKDKLASAKVQLEPETIVPEQEAGVEISAPAKKDAFWTSGFWKERLKGIITPFGFLEFYRAEKFRRPTGEVAIHVDALASLIQQETNLTLEEAQKEAQEILQVLKEEGIEEKITAVDYERISRDITSRKKGENDEEAAYIVKTAEDEIYDKLQERGHKGEAGQELLTREKQLAIRENLFAELNKLRDGALATDRKELAKLIRRNLDEKWNWRYVWGGVDAALWFLGIAALSTKFLASKEAVAMGSKLVVGGVGSAEAAREFVQTGMHENIWNTLKEMTQNGPGKFTPTDGQLKEWSQSVLDAIKHYEPEWMNNMIEGLKSSRAMPEAFSLKVPAEVMREMKYTGF